MTRVDETQVIVPEPVALQCALQGVSFPAHPRDLVRHALSHGVSSEIVQALATLPLRSYEGPNQLCMALCGRHAGNEIGP
ncbi:DUF2795 domain-containing protein [Embleya sp. NBC_00896]|uniref:DUF2795 domain-containing protein n=1 Tax=Embleya sp. NBC_00896 TaxID=2975961 RepID=UPI002F91268E|nr:DUF2795 domain-containing protein [Embleya sp. NBC_00896]